MKSAIFTAIMSLALLSSFSHSQEDHYENNTIKLNCKLNEDCKLDKILDLAISLSIKMGTGLNKNINYELYVDDNLVESTTLENYILSKKPELIEILNISFFSEILDFNAPPCHIE